MHSKARESTKGAFVFEATTTNARILQICIATHHREQSTDLDVFAQNEIFEDSKHSNRKNAENSWLPRNTFSSAGKAWTHSC
jgi:hypothetical protein